MRSTNIALLLIFSFFCLSKCAEWTQAGLMPTARSDFTATLWNNTVYLAGGCVGKLLVNEYGMTLCNTTAVFESYNIITKEWTTLPPLPHPRHRHTAVAANNNIYVMAGVKHDETFVSQIDVFNTATKQWVLLPNMEIPTNHLRTDAAAFVLNEVIYILGGYNQEYESLGSAISLDTKLINPTWALDSIGRLNTNRGDFCVGMIGTNVYAYGGFNEDWCVPISSLEEFNSASNTWSYKAPDEIAADRGDKVCVASNDPQALFVIGGEKKDSPVNCTMSIPVNDVEIFSPGDNKWTRGPDLPVSIFRMAGVSYDHEILIFGGQGPIQMEGGQMIHPIYNTIYSLSLTDDSTTTGSCSSLSIYLLTILFLISLSLFI